MIRQQKCVERRHLKSTTKRPVAYVFLLRFSHVTVNKVHASGEKKTVYGIRFGYVVYYVNDMRHYATDQFGLGQVKYDMKQSPDLDSFVA